MQSYQVSISYQGLASQLQIYFSLPILPAGTKVSYVEGTGEAVGKGEISPPGQNHLFQKLMTSPGLSWRESSTGRWRAAPGPWKPPWPTLG
jgi:hypothetical protein